MISLNVYLSAKPGSTAALEHAIDGWIDAMALQPGFVRAAVVRPYAEDHLKSLEATKPVYEYEVVSYWNSEDDRVAWTKRPIIWEVWPKVEEEAGSLTYTLFDVTQNWKM